MWGSASGERRCHQITLAPSIILPFPLWALSCLLPAGTSLYVHLSTSLAPVSYNRVTVIICRTAFRGTQKTGSTLHGGALDTLRHPQQH
jgi:hypothetical protein